MNESNTDRTVRVAVGIALVTFTFLMAPRLSTGAEVALYAIAGIALITGLVGFCPLYRALGINTCPAKRA